MSRIKQTRHESIATVMLSGKPVSIEEFHTIFKGTDLEKIMYRLPMYITFIRQEGGLIKQVRDGRKVIGYQLINPEEFNEHGRFIGIKKPEPTPESEPTEVV